METRAETIDEAVRTIDDAVHPLRIILFGSAVRGEIHEHSDGESSRRFIVFTRTKQPRNR